jgi:flagellar protein FlaG
MEIQEDSMTEAISPTGSPGSTSPAAYAAAQGEAAQVSAKVGTVTVASAETKAIQKAAQVSQASQEAAELDLSPSAGVSRKQERPSMTMEEAAQAFKDYLKSLPSNLQFQPDYQAGIVVFRVVNPVTQKVIRQLPPEEVVQQARNLRMAERQGHSGILLDESL